MNWQLRSCFLLNIAQSAFLIEYKHTIKVLRQQKLYRATKYWECFQIKTGRWVEFKLYCIDATGSVERCSGSGRPRTARSPDTMWHGRRTVRSEPHWLHGVGDPTRVCTTTTGSQIWKSCASLSRWNGTVWTRKWLTMRSVNGASDWQPALQPAEDILNIHSEHYCVCSHTD